MLVSDFVFVALFVKQSLCRFAKRYGWGIRGQCPSVAANKWENGTSVYIFPMLANNVDLPIFGVK